MTKVTKFAVRLFRAVRWRAARLRAHLRVTGSVGNAEVGEFWRSHGAEWAREQAEPEDLSRISGFLTSLNGLPESQAAPRIAEMFRQIWDDGFSDPDGALDWNEMGDRLPDVALLAFARGADEVHRLSSEVP